MALTIVVWIADRRPTKIKGGCSSLAITGMKDLPGIYVTILASEDRSKELRQRRPSVRRQLKQEPRSAEKKAPVRKKKEPER